MTGPDPNELTEHAKKAIADAVAIVREDRLTKMLNERLPAPPPPAPPADPPAGPADPPGKKPPAEPKPKKLGLFWGDRIEDDPEPVPDPPKDPVT